MVTAFHVTRPDAPEYPAYFGDEAYARKLAERLGTSILAVSFDIKKPFYNDVHDPFMDVSRLTRIWERDDLLFYLNGFEAQLKDTNQWERLTEKYGKNLTFRELFFHHYDDFLTLPLDCERFFTNAAIVSLIAARGYDGVAFNGKGFAEGVPMYVPFNRLGVRFGEEVHAGEVHPE